jgi:SulP family sulfate permease
MEAMSKVKFPTELSDRYSLHEEKPSPAPVSDAYGVEFGCRPGWACGNGCCRLVWNFIKDNKFEVISAITAALAQIPEAVAFSFVAGVRPTVGLMATWIMGVVTGLLGGRPGMISGATSSLAVVLAKVTTKYDNPIAIFYTVMIAGVFQILFGLLRLGKLMRLVPESVMVGFANGLAIIILIAQFGSLQSPTTKEVCWMDGCPNIGIPKSSRILNAFDVFSNGKQWVPLDMMGLMWIQIVICFTLCMVLPKISKWIPSAMVAIAVGTFIEWVIYREGLGVSTYIIKCIAGPLSGAYPIPIWIDSNYKSDIQALPFTLDLLIDLLPEAIIIAVIAIIETLMTLRYVDQHTKTTGSPNREVIAQGVANITCGIFGGMGGCAMLGQTILNLRAGGKKRISTFLCGIFVLLVLTVASWVIERLPVAALIGVMFSVVVETFVWSSIKPTISAIIPQKIREQKFNWYCKVHRWDVLVMLIVVVLALFEDLAIAVIAGVIVACLGLAWNMGNDFDALIYTKRDFKDDVVVKVVKCRGRLFFGGVDKFKRYFSPVTDRQRVEVDFEDCDIADQSSIEVLQLLGSEYAELEKEFIVRSLQPESLKTLQKAKHLMPNVVIEEQGVQSDETATPSELTIDELDETTTYLSDELEIMEAGASDILPIPEFKTNEHAKTTESV